MTDSLAIIIAGFLAIFLAGTIQGLAAFGFVLVSVPILIIFLSPKIVVPIVVMHRLLISLAMLFETRKWVDLKRIWPLLISSLAGLPLGTYLLIVLDVRVLKALIGALIVPFAIAFLIGFKKQIKSEKLALAPVGFFSGVLTGSTALSAPPVALFFANQGMEKHTLRANLVTHAVVLTSVAIPTFMLGGIVTTEVIKYTIWFLPALILGTIIGIKLAHKVNETLFRNTILTVIIVAGLLSIASGLGIF